MNCTLVRFGKRGSTSISDPSARVSASDSASRGITQCGLPIVPRPYDIVADLLGIRAENVRDRLQGMLAEGLVRRIGAEFNLVPQKPKKEKSRDLKRVEEELSDLLTATVEVRVKKRVKRHGRIEEMGEVSIQFGSLDELNGLIERLRTA